MDRPGHARGILSPTLRCSFAEADKKRAAQWTALECLEISEA